MGETLEEVPLPPDVILTDEVIKDTPEHVKKLAAELLTLNVLDVNSLCDHLQGRLGLTDSDLFGSLGSGGGGGGGGAGAVEVAEVVEEKTSFDLKLTAFDPKSKIKIIKEVRAVTDLGLKEAKELVESAPCTVKNGLSKEEGEKLLASLTELGATVELA
jgi:large subunit ribosomal protein L7/L12